MGREEFTIHFLELVFSGLVRLVCADTFFFFYPVFGHFFPIFPGERRPEGGGVVCRLAPGLTKGLKGC